MALRLSELEPCTTDWIDEEWLKDPENPFRKLLMIVYQTAGVEGLQLFFEKVLIRPDGKNLFFG